MTLFHGVGVWRVDSLSLARLLMQGDRLGHSARLLEGSREAIVPGHGLGMVGAEHSLLVGLVVAPLRHLMSDRVAGGQRIGVLGTQDTGSGIKDSAVLGFSAGVIAPN